MHTNLIPLSLNCIMKSSARRAGGEAATLSDSKEVGHDIEVTMPQTLSGVRVTGCLQWEAD